jgi:hypothetical protein
VLGQVARRLELVALEHELLEAEVVIDIFVAPEPLVAGRLDGESSSGISSCLKSAGSEKEPITIRISTGPRVHADLEAWCCG